MKISFKFVLFFLFLSFNLFAQQLDSNRIAILPFSTNGVDSISLRTAEYLLRIELGKFKIHDIVSDKKTREVLTDEEFTNTESAVEIGKSLNAGQVVYCILSVLGERIICQFTLVDVIGERELLVDRITALSVEDLENAMKRIAVGIRYKRSLDQKVEVGTITEAETTATLKRGSNSNLGLSFGYLYPQYGYDGEGRTFVLDLRYGYELNDIALGTLFGFRHGIAINIYASYLTTKTDFCPFVGGSFGFHWINHKEEKSHLNPTGKKGDGFELAIQSGIRLFRTYKFQVLLNLEYVFSFNDFNDRAIVFTLGIL